jgi:ABC-type cobalamin/Fe3+-siderophores transport system ATPase subunit
METAVELRGVTYSYPADNPDDITEIFNGVSATIPTGMVAIVGPNGIGKSTLLLLAGGRLFPQEGSVTLLGTETNEFARAALDPEVEEKRNRLVSFVYQNMEFETDESVGKLMEFVYENGFNENPSDDFLSRIRAELEMESFLTRKTQELAKGQLQRAIIAFSLLYGSKMLMMDEPVFALEEPQKVRAFGLLKAISEEQHLPIYFTVHNLKLSQRYSDYVVLFSDPGHFSVGPSAEMLTRERLEAAYKAPLDTLHQKDQLYREMLQNSPGTDAESGKEE